MIALYQVSVRNTEIMSDFGDPGGLQQRNGFESPSGAAEVERHGVGSSPVSDGGRFNGKADKRPLVGVARVSRRALDMEAGRLMDHLTACGLGPTESIEVLRFTLERYDPQYKRAMQSLGLVDAIRTGFARQPKNQDSRGFAKALQDIAFQGSAQRNYSRSAAAEMLGMGRKRRGQSSSGDILESLREPRKRRKTAFGMDVVKAVAEFAYCYCKYEEKKYVSTLTADSVWKIYCQYHNRAGDFFPMGNADV